jgi:4-amino-4-deoxy-L-arabinose transferase-like glycosyltransferase
MTMQNFWKFNKDIILLFLIIVLGAFFRFYNLNWDQGHYLHPDERLYVNASNITLPKNLGDFFTRQSPLNPHMFYYGTFPLYLYKIVNVLIFPSVGFPITSRIISAFLSILTIPIIFFIGKEFFSKKIGILSAFIFAFSSGSIQYAHFNTTESILIFLLSLILLLSIKNIKQKKHVFYALILGLLTGISYATKITGLTFTVIPLISFILIYAKERKISKLIALLTIFIVSAMASGFLFAPYQIIDYKQFSQEQTYMQGVTYGKDKPPFVIIYEGTTPYVYPLIKILPFTFGFVSLPLSLVGVYFLIKNLREKKLNYNYLFLLAYPLLYFLFSGAWFTKFSRYYILLFPFLSLWAGYLLNKFSRNYLRIILLLIAINGLLFTRIYLKENTRVQASEWIYANIPNQSKIAGEHWDDNLPLPLPNAFGKNFTTSQLTVYEPDSSEKILKLSKDLSENEYFIISSRRVYYSILINKDKYPLTGNFYKLLFDGKLGYKLEKKFTNYPFFLSDDFADESFQSYDHPPVYILKNITHMSFSQIKELISKI